MPEKTPEQVADELACYVYSPHHADFKRLTIEALRAAHNAALEEVRQYAETLWRAYDDPEGPETPAQLACENIIHFAKNKLKETQP